MEMSGSAEAHYDDRHSSNVPCQLPKAVAHFVGRRAEMSMLSAQLERMPVVFTLSGLAGVGKTTLAISWAQQIVDRFPDGQLYSNLRGFDPSGEPVQPSEVLRSFLESLGVHPNHIPLTLDAQAARYRNMLEGKRVLVLLDNARSVDQVRPLLPASAHCFTLVTSRSQLLGLKVRDSALTSTLKVFSQQDALYLLRSFAGDKRVDGEPAAALSLVERCAGSAIGLGHCRRTNRRPANVLAPRGRRRTDECFIKPAGFLHRRQRHGVGHTSSVLVVVRRIDRHIQPCVPTVEYGSGP